MGVNSDIKKCFVRQLMTYPNLFDSWAWNLRLYQMQT